MSDVSPGDLSARLVVDFCVPMMQGKVEAKSPVPGRPLDAAERTELGIEGEGTTLVFDTKPTRVLMDMAGARALVWFKEADCKAAGDKLDAELRKAFPAIRQLEGNPHPSGRAMRLRAYRLDLADDKLCTIEVGFPSGAAEGEDLTFVVRVNAFKRAPGAPEPPKPAQPPAAPASKSKEKPQDKPKKKGWF